jgi:hypothetical protein
MVVGPLPEGDGFADADILYVLWIVWHGLLLLDAHFF